MSNLEAPGQIRDIDGSIADGAGFTRRAAAAGMRAVPRPVTTGLADPTAILGTGAMPHRPKMNSRVLYSTSRATGEGGRSDGFAEEVDVEGA